MIGSDNTEDMWGFKFEDDGNSLFGPDIVLLGGGADAEDDNFSVHVGSDLVCLENTDIAGSGFKLHPDQILQLAHAVRCQRFFQENATDLFDRGEYQTLQTDEPGIWMPRYPDAVEAIWRAKKRKAA